MNLFVWQMAYFTKKGIRDKVDITFVTPLPGAFTKPVATKLLGEMLEEKNIKVIPDFYIEKIDNDKKYWFHSMK